MNPLFTKATLLFQQGRYALAEQSLREALSADPGGAFGHSMLARCLAAQEKYAAALEEAREGARLAPDDDFAHFVLAEVHLHREEEAAAQAAAERAVDIDPEDADNWGMLAAVHSNRSNWPPCLEAAERGLAIDAEHRACIGFRATALMRLGRADEARSTAVEALARDPEDDVAHCNQGWALLHEGRPREAIPHFQEALRLDPHYEAARTGLVEALKAGNRTYGALLYLTLWVSRWPAKYQWMFVVAYVVVLRTLSAATREMPYARVAVRMLNVTLLMFWLFTVLAGPLFTLTLRLSQFGRQVLTPAQRAASNWHAALMAIVVLALATWPWIGYLTATLTAIVFTHLVPPVTETYDCPPGPARRRMAAYTALLAAVGIAAIAPLFLIALGPPATRGAVAEAAVAAIIRVRLPPMLVLTFPLWGTLVVLIGSYFSDNVARRITRRYRNRD